jgi:indole-3-glycerol phosphate synthase
LRAFDDATAAALVETAAEICIDALIEVHDEADLARALPLGAPLIGINNRDLRTFETRLETSEKLAAVIPKDRVAIAESGIFTPADVARLKAAGINALLVGESLMRQPDVAAATRALLAPAPAAAGSAALAGS